MIFTLEIAFAAILLNFCSRSQEKNKNKVRIKAGLKHNSTNTCIHISRLENVVLSENQQYKHKE